MKMKIPEEADGDDITTLLLFLTAALCWHYRHRRYAVPSLCFEAAAAENSARGTRLDRLSHPRRVLGKILFTPR